MPDPRQLPFLLDLLEDDSPVVQEAVRRELARYGPQLPGEIGRLTPPLTASRRRAVESLLAEPQREWLADNWATWKARHGDKERLEAALSLLAEYQNGPALSDPLPPRLDRLAEEFRAGQGAGDPAALARYLFRRQGLHGAGTDYYSPQNSNLSAVIRRRRGLPISLCCIYILVGRRLGLDLQGCNFPGHFLASFRSPAGTLVFVDAFDGGRLLEENLILGMFPNPAPDLRRILETPASAEVIVARLLRNLVMAYQKAGQLERARLMQELLRGGS